MSGFDRATVDVLLTQALRDRALDVGDEAEFARKVASVATTQPPLRREALRWPVFAPRRGVLVLVTALLALTVLAAGLIGYGVFIRGPVPPIVSNGPILIADDIGGSWWADPTTFEEITAGVPAVPSGIQAAAWSRDGERLALDVQGDLEILDADSGERRPIARCAAIGWACTSGIRTRSLEWSPDGAAIAIANGARLVVIDVASGQVRTLVGPVDDAAPRILASPSWSPDGRWIAFELDDTRLSGLGAMRQLHVIRPDGSDLHRLDVEMPSDSLGMTQPIWSVRHDAILVPASDWREGAPDDPDELWFVALSTSDGQLLGEPARIATLGSVPCAGCIRFTLAPDKSALILEDAPSVSLGSLDRPGTSAVREVDGLILAWRPVP